MIDRRGLLVMMSGLPGSGKSTVARRFAKLLTPRYPDVQIIATDIVRKELFNPLTYSDEENSFVHREVQLRLIAALQDGAIAIYDATNLRVQFRDWVDVAQGQSGCSVLIVQTVAADAEIRERIVARQAKGNSHSDADVSVYELLLASAEPVQRPHHVIRTDTDYEADFALALDAITKAANL